MYRTFRFLRSQIFAVWSSLPVNLHDATCLIDKILLTRSMHTQIVIQSWCNTLEGTVGAAVGLQLVAIGREVYA